eukprot:CAMPEP_0194161836 /NCGR_PEP_ID=MMETSP0152-20130528/79161_1 /TAXON_ID=1049557 /ORGANISM="Thalassiothrix antarctica, Strain L6-D1" /LENGTH=309 /DNA_ID=CAMNT_0038871667 /DNA_START=156 /DNA_END=1085 /DNA_ORIENTATION=+
MVYAKDKFKVPNPLIEDKFNSMVSNDISYQPTTTTASIENSSLGKVRTRAVTPPPKPSSFVPPPPLKGAVSSPIYRTASKTKTISKEKKKSFFSQRADIFVPSDKSDLIECDSPRRRSVQRQPVYNPNNQIEKRMSELLNNTSKVPRKPYNPPCYHRTTKEREKRMSELLNNTSKVPRKPYNPPCYHRTTKERLLHKDDGEDRLPGVNKHSGSMVKDRVTLTPPPTASDGDENLQQHNVHGDSFEEDKALLARPPTAEQIEGPPMMIIIGRPTHTMMERNPSMDSLVSDITMSYFLSVPETNDGTKKEE